MGWKVIMSFVLTVFLLLLFQIVLTNDVFEEFAENAQALNMHFHLIKISLGDFDVLISLRIACEFVDRRAVYEFALSPDWNIH